MTRNLACSRLSLSFNEQRRSGIERSRAASGGMVVVVSKSVTGNVTKGRMRVDVGLAGRDDQASEKSQITLQTLT